MNCQPPGPRLPMTVQTPLFSMFRHRWLPHLARRHGPVIHLRVSPELDVAVLSDVDQIRSVFLGSTSTFHAGEANTVFEPAMGEHSVLSTDEDAHLRLRKQLIPAFRGSALHDYQDMITTLVAEEVERWPVGTPFSSLERMNAVTLEIILRVMFGVEAGHRLDELRARLNKVLEISAAELLAENRPWLQRFGHWRRAAANKQRVDELLYAEIADRRLAGDLGLRRDVLSRLLTVSSTAQRPSDTELHDHLVTLLFAGHETIATALAWSFHELARHPAILDAAVRSAVAGEDRYLEAVVKEVLRLRPVIVEVTRRLTEDTEVGGYRIPAGWTVMPSIVLVHQDPVHFAEPAEFRPERFLESSPPAGSWLPFGGGVRRCLGAGFAVQQGVIVLREVLSRFRIEPASARPEQPRLQHLTLVPSRGARIVVRPRIGA
ncbi:cytochrome P450 [Nocardia sp. NPDC051570]|uniref:cytochrome P450 n=1 Tax=Nocardia sp. NPDC051570 TaxID=3364324 RepID=UPI0037A86E4F